MYNLIILKTDRYKQFFSSNIIQSILTYKPMRSVSFLRLPKNFKKQTG